MRLQLILLGILCTGMVQAQTAERTVLSSNGGYETNGNLSMEWTMGEFSSSTSSNGNLLITEGFQQGGDISIGIDELTINLDITIYPNPTDDLIHISRSDKDDVNLFIQLYNSDGKLISDSQLVDRRSTIELSNYAAGKYSLSITTESGDLILTKQVIKLR